MQRDLYPPDWPEIAERLKEAAGWQCQDCGAKRGELRENRHGEMKPVVVTVAHLDHDPWNRDARLRVLCGACHIKYDATQRKRQRRMMQIARGQMVLVGMRRWYHVPVLKKRR